MRLLSVSRLFCCSLSLLTALAFTAVGCSSGTTAPPAPNATLSASSLTFATTPVGTAAASQTVTLTNTGTASLSGITVTINGGGGFTVSSTTCGSTLAANASCTATISFTPTSAGALTAALIFTDSASSSQQSVSLAGTGAAAQAQLSVSSLTFIPTLINTTAATQTVTLTNTGNLTLTGLSAALAGSSTFTDTSTCGTTLAAAASCTVTVTFKPTAAGAVSGTLTFSDSVPAAQVVTLYGTGNLPTEGAGIKVTVLAGTTPVVGASVQFYAAGTTGNGLASTALLSTAATTDSTGSVTVAAGFMAPTTTSQIYAIAQGGKLGSAAVNPAITLFSALGTANQLSTAAPYIVNEVTTAAGVYALAQFMAKGGVVGATSTNSTGLANAFATAASLAGPTTGVSPGPSFPTNGTAPSARLYTIANLLNSCTAQVATNSCTYLFNATAVYPNAAPTNTLDAALSLVLHPAASVTSLFTLSSTSTAFAGSLSAQPSDWTLFTTFSGGGMNSPSGLGIDSKGNVRVANYFNVASAFSPTGAALYANGVTGFGLDNSYGLAVDASDNVWIPNEQSPYAVNTGLGSVSVLNIAGGSVAGNNGYSSGGLNYPISTAIDPNTNAWVVDYGNSHVTLLTAAGTPLSGTSGYTTSLFAFPVAVALDANHFGWIANQSSNTVTKVAPDGSAFTNFNCCNGASGLAVDQHNNIWVANYYGASISEIGSTGTILANQTLTANGNINHPQGVAIDGAGNVWVTNFRASYLTELAGANASTPGTPLSPSPGYAPESGLLEAYAIAIDASGNIWITNFGNNTITQFVGLATPVKTPLLAVPQLP